MMDRLALVLAACLLSLWKPCLGGDPAVDASDGTKMAFGPKSGNEERPCTFDELLPLPSRAMSAEWSSEYVVDPPYDCTCANVKAKYFCPTQENTAYHKWVPQAVASGSCTSATREELDRAPLPPNFKILLYGNSHMRQVTQSMMCMYQGALTSKRVVVGPLDAEAFVGGDGQCRACDEGKSPEDVSDLQASLVDNGCISVPDIDNCNCDDKYGEFFFENGATAHYTLSHRQGNKGLQDALREHKNGTLSSYDVVFMNVGNAPHVSSAAALATAIEVQNAGAQFVWLSTYQGLGGPGKWPESQRESFIESGAKYLDVGSMMRGMNAWTVGKVEGGRDSHFCLPGPPNEIAVLMVKLLWAMYNGE